jgi:hypothetical protein
MELVKRFFYGHVLRFLALTLPPVYRSLEGSSSNHTRLLAVIAPVELSPDVNRLGTQFQKGDSFKPSQIMDIASIQCVV